MKRTHKNIRSNVKSRIQNKGKNKSETNIITNHPSNSSTFISYPYPSQHFQTSQQIQPFQTSQPTQPFQTFQPFQYSFDIIRKFYMEIYIDKHRLIGKYPIIKKSDIYR